MPDYDINRVSTRSDLKPGDIGYITYLHGVLYAQEYGWDYTFDGYVASGLAEFAQLFNPERDRLWIAEMDGRIVGSIGIVGHTDGEAQLRWFLVHPGFRGRGLGRDLLEKAVQFCRDRGFESVFLWTVEDLEAAAHLYRSVGFRRTKGKTHKVWGRMLTEERYDLVL
jgi:GNAT superfamily N-acetyltransferase